MSLIPVKHDLRQRKQQELLDESQNFSICKSMESSVIIKQSLNKISRLGSLSIFPITSTGRMLFVSNNKILQFTTPNLMHCL